MNTQTLFRTLLVASPVLGILSVCYGIFAPAGFSQDWQDLITWSGDDSWIVDFEAPELSLKFVLSVALILLFIVTAIFTQIGLFLYWPPARPIYLTLCLFSFGLTALGGLVVSPPLESLGLELCTFIDGMILAFAYFSPIAEKFRRSVQPIPE